MHFKTMQWLKKKQRNALHLNIDVSCSPAQIVMFTQGLPTASVVVNLINFVNYTG